VRIRIIQSANASSVDGLDLTPYRVGFEYDVGTTLASLMLAQGWAEPVHDGRPALVVPLEEFAPDAKRRESPRGLFPGHVPIDRSIAADAMVQPAGKHSPDPTEGTT